MKTKELFTIFELLVSDNPDDTNLGINLLRNSKLTLKNIHYLHVFSEVTYHEDAIPTRVFNTLSDYQRELIKKDYLRITKKLKIKSKEYD